MNIPEITRRITRAIDVGGVVIGDDAPVSIQSMTNTPTRDAEATIEQIRRLAEAGAELVRVAVPRADDTAALPQIVAESPVPIIADVHFHFDRALEAISAGVAKIRLNPGNIADRDQVLRIIDAAGAAGVAIRVGVNEGSVVDRQAGEQRDSDLAAPLAGLMVAKMAEYLEVFEAAGFDRLVLSAKSHDVVTTVAMTDVMIAEGKTPEADVGVETADVMIKGTSAPRVAKRPPLRKRRWRPRPKQRTAAASAAASATTQLRPLAKRGRPSR